MYHLCMRDIVTGWSSWLSSNSQLGGKEGDFSPKRSWGEVSDLICISLHVHWQTCTSGHRLNKNMTRSGKSCNFWSDLSIYLVWRSHSWAGVVCPSWSLLKRLTRWRPPASLTFSNTRGRYLRSGWQMTTWKRRWAAGTGVADGWGEKTREEGRRNDVEDRHGTRGEGEKWASS